MPYSTKLVANTIAKRSAISPRRAWFCQPQDRRRCERNHDVGIEQIVGPHGTYAS